MGGYPPPGAEEPPTLLARISTPPSRFNVCVQRSCALGRANVGFDEGIGLGQPDRCPAIRTGTSRLPQWPGKAGRSAPSASSSRTLRATATEAWPIFSTMWSPTAWSNGPGTLGQAAQPHPVRMRILARSCERGRRLRALPGVMRKCSEVALIGPISPTSNRTFRLSTPCRSDGHHLQRSGGVTEARRRSCHASLARARKPLHRHDGKNDKKPRAQGSNGA